MVGNGSLRRRDLPQCTTPRDREALYCFNGPDRARTDHLFHAMEALYQMSYRPYDCLKCAAEPSFMQWVGKTTLMQPLRQDDRHSEGLSCVKSRAVRITCLLSAGLVQSYACSAFSSACA